MVWYGLVWYVLVWYVCRYVCIYIYVCIYVRMYVWKWSEVEMVIKIEDVNQFEESLMLEVKEFDKSKR